MNKFKPGEFVCFDDLLNYPKWTIDKVNPDGTYLCFWVNYKSKKRNKKEVKTFKESELVYWVSQAGAIQLRGSNTFR